ncbi:MAG: hypothetical protein V3W04_11060 [Gammaproteobacteria bacterium]
MKSNLNPFKKRLRTCLISGLGAAAVVVASSNALALLPFKNDSNLYIAMWTANTYNIFNKKGKTRGSISAQGLDGPRGLAFNPANRNLWVTSEHGNEIFIFDNQHRLRRSFTHPDFLEPVGISFKMKRGVKPKNQEVYISNSGNSKIDPEKGNNIMVFNQKGKLLRSFTRPGLIDPNCTAFFPDGSFYVSNRLGLVDGNGNADGIVGRVDKFDANDKFLFSFTVKGMLSLMAVARDPNGPGRWDDTLWATSGGGDRGIYEFDQNGELLRSILPGDLANYNGVAGADIVPQGIAFDDKGNMTVASFAGGVYQFDGDGNHINSYNPGSGNSRSIAFRLQRRGHRHGHHSHMSD